MSTGIRKTFDLLYFIILYIQHRLCTGHFYKVDMEGIHRQLVPDTKYDRSCYVGVILLSNILHHCVNTHSQMNNNLHGMRQKPKIHCTAWSNLRDMLTLPVSWLKRWQYSRDTLRRVHHHLVQTSGSWTDTHFHIYKKTSLALWESRAVRYPGCEGDIMCWLHPRGYHRPFLPWYLLRNFKTMYIKYYYTSEEFILYKTTADKWTIHHFSRRNELLTGW